MIHPNTDLKFISKEKGHGVVATRFIPKGTITWAMDPLDHTFTPKQVEAMEKMFQDIIYTYCYRDSVGNFVLCWDHSRFVNHSFHSNTISTAYNFELAVKDIYPGEELTNDYGYLNIIEPFDCLPEPGTNRTQVLPDDLLRYYSEWDNKLVEAFKNFNHVPQPLSKLIEPQYASKVKLVAEGKVKMDSILNCYYDDRRKKVAA